MLGSQIQLTALARHVYQLTGDPMQLGFLGPIRLPPILLFGLLGGLIDDQRDRRVTLLATQLALLLTSATLAFTTMIGAITVGLSFAITIGSVSVAAISGPARQSPISTPMRRNEINGVTTINILASQPASVAGAALGESSSPCKVLTGAYVFDVSSFFAEIANLLLIRR